MFEKMIADKRMYKMDRSTMKNILHEYFSYWLPVKQYKCKVI